MLLEISKFGGVAPKVLDPVALAVGKSQAAQNCRFDEGGIVPYQTDSFIETPPGRSPSILSLYTYWIGNRMYFLTWASDVDAVEAPLPNDMYNRVFYTESGILKVTDQNIFMQGGTNYPMAWVNPSPPAPVNTPIISAVIAGTNPALMQTRGYVYTLVNAYGEEGPPSPVSNLFNIYDGNPATLSGMDTSVDSSYNIQTKRIYRINQTAGSGAQYQFLTEIPLSRSTFFDVILNSALGEVLPSAEWDGAPSGIKGLIVLPNGMLAGFVNTPANLVCLSVPYYPHAWPARYQKAIDSPIIGLGSFGTTIAVLTEGQPYVIVGNDPENLVMEKMDTGLSCLSKRGVAHLPDVIYPSPEGLVQIGPQGWNNLTEDLMNKDQWQSRYNPASITAFDYDGKYVAFYQTATKQAGFIFDPKTKDLVDLDFYATAGFRDPVDGTLYLVVGGNIVAFARGGGFNVGGFVAGGEVEAVGYLSMTNLGVLSADPDTTGWGSAQEGWCWYNATDHHYKYWDGTKPVLM